jgi:hypothetical protein
MNSGAVTEAAQRVGIFGAGKSGTAIARRAVEAGYTVKIAASGPADQTTMITNIVTPGVIATDIGDLATDTDIVVLAVPLRRFTDLPLTLLADRIVIDVMTTGPRLTACYPSSSTPTSLPASASVMPCRQRPDWRRPSTTSATTRSKTWPVPPEHPAGPHSPSAATTPPP